MEEELELEPYELSWEEKHHLATTYTGMAGGLAGLSFAALYFYINYVDTNILAYLTMMLLLITTLMFLFGTIGYADASKILNNKIIYKMVKQEEFIERKVDWDKCMHLADMFTLFGFILMLASLSIGLIAFNWSLGLIATFIIWTLFFYYMIKSPAHG